MLQKEIVKLDRKESDLDKSYTSLCTFIISDKFLTDNKAFQTCLNEFSNNTVTMLEVAQAPIVMPPSTNISNNTSPNSNEENEQNPTEFSRSKALAVGMVNVAVALTIVYAGLPPLWIVGVAVGSTVLIFLSQIINALKMLFAEKKEDALRTTNPARWIHKQIAYMRTRYESAYLFVQAQNQSKQNLGDYAYGRPEVFYNRAQQLNITLPTDFLNKIGEIMDVCKQNLWLRKAFLVNAMTACAGAASEQTAKSP